jgi:hypothetical protein
MHAAVRRDGLLPGRAEQFENVLAAGKPCLNVHGYDGDLRREAVGVVFNTGRNDDQLAGRERVIFFGNSPNHFSAGDVYVVVIVDDARLHGVTVLMLLAGAKKGRHSHVAKDIIHEGMRS